MSGSSTVFEWHVTEDGMFEYWIYLNRHFMKALPGCMAWVIGVDGGFMKSFVLSGWVLLIATTIDTNNFSINIAYMLCPSESKKHVTIFMQAIQASYPFLFAEDAPCKLLITADRGTGFLSVLPKLPNVVLKSCAYHLKM